MVRRRKLMVTLGEQDKEADFSEEQFASFEITDLI